MPDIISVARWNFCNCCGKSGTIILATKEETVLVDSKEEGHNLINAVLKRRWILEEEAVLLRRDLDASEMDDVIPDCEILMNRLALVPDEDEDETSSEPEVLVN